MSNHAQPSLLFNQKVVNKIAELTGGNHHTEALIAGAKMLKMENVVKKLKHVLALHELEGYMPQDLYEYRHDLSEEVMKYAKDNLSKEEFKSFCGAF